jgi:hypothetical protein
MRTLERFALGRHRLIPANIAGHVVLLQLLQDNILQAAKFRAPLLAVPSDRMDRNVLQQ